MSEEVASIGERAERDAVENRGRRTQAERTATAARRMIRAAGALIARQGYSKTTLAQVGREAGYSGGLVSHHFGSKEGLLRALIGHVTARFNADQIAPATVGERGLDALCALARAYLEELRLREERMRTLYVLMGESLGPVAEIGDVIANLNDGFRADAARLIEQGIADGEIRADADPRTESAVFLALLRGIGLQWMTEPGCVDLDTVIASVERSIRRQLGTEDGA